MQSFHTTTMPTSPVKYSSILNSLRAKTSDLVGPITNPSRSRKKVQPLFRADVLFWFVQINTVEVVVPPVKLVGQNYLNIPIFSPAKCFHDTTSANLARAIPPGSLSCEAL